MQEDNERIPRSFICRITTRVMEDPVVGPSGCTYERSAIEEWLDTHDTCPLTGKELTREVLVPNLNLREAIEEWRSDHSSGNVTCY